MTTTVPATSGPSAPETPGAPAPAASPQRWRRWVPFLLIGTVLVAAVALTVATASQPGQRTPYDPESTQSDGTRALVNVLRDHGVDVDVVRSAGALERARTGSDTTVMVTETAMLSRSAAAHLRTLADAGETRVVVAAPDPYAGRLLHTPDPVAGTDRPVTADCSPSTFNGLTVRSDSTIVYAYSVYEADSGCFEYSPDGRDGAVLVKRGNLWTWGAPQALTNEQILRADNAAIGLRLLGERPHLVWYVPSYADLTSGDGHSVGDLIPHWIAPGLWLATVAVVVLAYARGRRLGPLAVEPLPVSVRADETTRALGRLYRRAGDRAHAAYVLRRASRTRLAARLGLGRGASDDDVVRTVAVRTGRPPAEVATLLGDEVPPRTDHDLIALADHLAALEEELRP